MSKLVVEGEVEASLLLDFVALAALPSQVPDLSLLVPGREGGAVALSSILTAAGVRSGATHATLESSDGRFSASVALAEIAKAVVAYRLGDGPLPPASGGPFRFFVPEVEGCAPDALSRCANVKRLGVIRLTAGGGAEARPRSEEEHAAPHAREGYA